ncbi:hypothetical protein GPECTOR_1g356 [Gonium pectorale]|uniref:Uncharacterized protein n=1 Tax=Gonium pectorale TaxID=33097 RepID=A0A150H4A1_GONPE|nr:hypothetical protein GPECTOR_1g356 [Gonium pectorale]|eukprot:KXZ56400.1 hypothetical protein GPECTOR_1g356 [Gonium pectorale]
MAAERRASHTGGQRGRSTRSRSVTGEAASPASPISPGSPTLALDLDVYRPAVLLPAGRTTPGYLPAWMSAGGGDGGGTEPGALPQGARSAEGLYRAGAVQPSCGGGGGSPEDTIMTGYAAGGGFGERHSPDAAVVAAQADLPGGDAPLPRVPRPATVAGIAGATTVYSNALAGQEWDASLEVPVRPSRPGGRTSGGLPQNGDASGASAATVPGPQGSVQLRGAFSAVRATDAARTSPVGGEAQTSFRKGAAKAVDSFARAVKKALEKVLPGHR